MINKDYILTDHAKQRMKERSISIKDLEVALEYPDISYKGKQEEINVVKKRLGEVRKPELYMFLKKRKRS